MRTYVQLDLGREAGSPTLEEDITLDDARYLVAREHGFENWDALVRDCSSRRASPAPAPLRRLAADANGKMTDGLLAELAELDDVTELRLGGSAGVTDAGLRAIGRMTQLTHLDLGGTSITDAGVAHLARCEHSEGREPAMDGHRRYRASRARRASRSHAPPHRESCHRCRSGECLRNSPASPRGRVARRRWRSRATTPARTTSSSAGRSPTRGCDTCQRCTACSR